MQRQAQRRAAHAAQADVCATCVAPTALGRPRKLLPLPKFGDGTADRRHRRRHRRTGRLRRRQPTKLVLRDADLTLVARRRQLSRPAAASRCASKARSPAITCAACDRRPCSIPAAAVRGRSTAASTPSTSARSCDVRSPRCSPSRCAKLGGFAPNSLRVSTRISRCRSADGRSFRRCSPPGDAADRVAAAARSISTSTAESPKAAWKTRGCRIPSPIWPANSACIPTGVEHHGMLGPARLRRCSAARARKAGPRRSTVRCDLQASAQRWCSIPRCSICCRPRGKRSGTTSCRPAKSMSMRSSRSTAKRGIPR